MSDVFIEYLVVKRPSGRDILLKVGIVVAAFLISAAAFLFLLPTPLGSIALLVVAGAIYGAYWLITSFNVEFEYSLTNGEMDVDKIIARRKRKRLITVKCKDFETFGRYTPEKHRTQNYQTRMIVCDDETGNNVWYATLRHKTMGHTLLVFNASEKMLTGMRAYLPRQLLPALNDGKFQVVSMKSDTEEQES